MNDSDLEHYLETTAGRVGQGRRETTTPRQLLDWFGAARRGALVVAQVRSRLQRHQLVTDPDFELAGIDEEISFRCVEKPLYIVRLDEIAAELKNERSPTVTVRTLLKWFGYERRGSHAISIISAALAEAGLATEPDFQDAHIDAELVFATVKTDSPQPEAQDRPPSELPPPMPVDTSRDATFRIGTLASASLKERMARVSPQTSLSRALTLMMSRDITHIPVMPSTRQVNGVVTWRGIAQHLALKNGKMEDPVESAMEPPPVLETKEPFFSAIQKIIDCGCALVRSPTNEIVGIVTKTDLSKKFHELAEPFLLLSEIENQIRGLVERANFTADELKNSCNEAEAREIRTLHDLTLGEYVRLLQNPDSWSRVQIAVDRAQFLADLEQVRQVRNNVMHFDPDSPTPSDLEVLQRFAQFLRTLRQREVF